jgi:PleD family two-component response regulator
VLLVEDNQTNQEVALELLRQVGIQADLAEDGAQAVAMARDYALMLMDCQMPVMDGLEATRQLRLDARHKDRGHDRQCHGRRRTALPGCRHGRLHRQAHRHPAVLRHLLRHLRPGMPQSLPGKLPCPAAAAAAMSF